MNRFLKRVIVAGSGVLVVLLLLGSVVGRTSKPEDVYRHFDVFTEVLTRIKSEYVEEPDMKDVTLGALNGLLEAIDPFASYLNEEQYRQYLKDRKQHRAGIGLLLSRKVGYVGVVDAIPGSPAAKAGLMTGDILETIGGVSTRDMPLAYAQMLLHGKAGTTVKFTVLRVGQSAESQEFSLVREPVRYPPVEGRILRSDIAYLKIQSLEKGKTQAVRRQLCALLRKGAKRILLDLRRAAAGNPAEGYAVADLFLDQGLMGYVKGQRYPRHEFHAGRRNTVTRLPVVVVINRGTAQGAEVAAAALLGNKRGPVVGERSYGDAAVRQPVELPAGGAVILSIAKYYAPNGKAIQDTGVVPTVVSIARPPAPVPGEQPPRIHPRPPVPLSEDTILQKAIEVLTHPGKYPFKAKAAKPATTPHRMPMSPLGIPEKPKQ